MNLVGFLARSGELPSPLISVGASDDRFFAKYPSGEIVEVADVDSHSQLIGRPSFVPVPDGMDGSKLPVFAFGVSATQVVAGPMPSVVGALRHILSTSINLDLEDRQAIRDFLSDIQVAAVAGKELSVGELTESLSGRHGIVVRMSSRKLRGRDQVAPSLIVQRLRKGATRTLYRKGIPFGKSLEDVKIPKPVTSFLLFDPRVSRIVA